MASHCEMDFIDIGRKYSGGEENYTGEVCTYMTRGKRRWEITRLILKLHIATTKVICICTPCMYLYSFTEIKNNNAISAISAISATDM